MKKLFVALTISVLVMMGAAPVMAISDEKEVAVREHCDEIRANLKEVQKTDAKTRVYLGRYYEKVLKDFVTPFNVRLIENNLSNAELVENQNKFAETKVLFSTDFVSYQQSLEELVTMDCKEEPAKFYEKLEIVRQKRKVMEQDTMRVRNLISSHLRLAEQLKGKL